MALGGTRLTRSLLPAGGAVALGLLLSCAPASPEPADAPLETLEAREASFLDALSARDADEVAAHFAPDGVLHVANMPEVRGREAVRELYGNIFRFMVASDPSPQAVRVSETGDMGYTMGRVVNAFRSGDGTMEYQGKYLIVWERREGDWFVAVYAVSSDAS
jgi:uncharacterized protein (TIGR02246 family)